MRSIIFLSSALMGALWGGWLAHPPKPRIVDCERLGIGPGDHVTLRDNRDGRMIVIKNCKGTVEQPIHFWRGRGVST